MQSNTELQLLPEFIKLRNEVFGIPQDFNGITLMGLTIDELFIHLVDGYKSNDNLRNSVTYEEYLTFFGNATSQIHEKHKFNKISFERNLNRFIKSWLNLISPINHDLKLHLEEDLNDLKNNRNLKESLAHLYDKVFVLFFNSDHISKLNNNGDDDEIELLIWYNILTLAELTFMSKNYYRTILREQIDKVPKKYKSLLLEHPKSISNKVKALSSDDLLRGQHLVIKLITDYEHVSDKEILEFHNIIMFKPLKELPL